MGTRLWVEEGRDSHFNLIDNSKKIRTYANVWQRGTVLYTRWSTTEKLKRCSAE